jgi:dihydroorotase
MKTLLKNGWVLDPAEGLNDVLDVRLGAGKIQDVGKNLEAEGARVLDLKGLTVFPGFIDLHTHLREPGFEYKEDIESGARAAVFGGFTTICAMPNTEPTVDQSGMVEYILKRGAEAGYARVLPIGTITKGRKGDELAEIGHMARSGAVGFSDDGDWVQSSSLMRRALEYAGFFDVPVISHAEDRDLSNGGQMNEGKLSYSLGLQGWPSQAEEIAVFRDICLSMLTRGRLHIAHVSCKEAMQLIRGAKCMNLRVTGEVTPHHLLFTEKDVRTFDPNFKMNPPLRKEGDAMMLLRGLVEGTIDCIATDHAPHTLFEKEVDFTSAPFGVIGLETAFPSLYTHLVLEEKLDLATLVASMTSRAADVFNLNDCGRIRPGHRADLVAYDLNKTWKVSPEALQSKSKNTPFLGKSLRARAIHTFVQGRRFDVET